MNRLRICQVAAGVGLGGMENHVLALSGALAKRHDVTLVAHESWRIRTPEGVAFAPVNLAAWRHDPRAARALGRALLSLEPNVVHAHASKAAMMTRAATAELGCARIATVHGLKRSARPYRGFDRVIAVSEATARRTALPNVVVIPNGVPPPRLPPTVGEALLAEIGAPNGQAVCCAVGRLAPVKGFDILLRAWREVQGALVIVGDGPERGALETLARQIGVADRVRFTGWRDDAPAIQASCDLCVISSRREGFPLCMVEALHVGTPIVSTRVPGAEDILPEAYLAPAEDPSALASRVNATISDLEGARRAFAPLFEKARRELTLEAMASRVEAVYHAALEARASRAAG